MYNDLVTPGPVIIDGTPLEVDMDYIYLGQLMVLSKYNFRKEADRRIRLD